MDTDILRREVEDNFKKRLYALEEERIKQLEAIDIVSKLSTVALQRGKEASSANEECLNALNNTASRASVDGLNGADMIRCVFESIKIGDFFTRTSFREIFTPMFPGKDASNLFKDNFSSTMEFLEKRGCVSKFSKRNNLVRVGYKKKQNFLSAREDYFKSLAVGSVEPKNIPKGHLVANEDNSNSLAVGSKVPTGNMTLADMTRTAFGSIKVGESFTRTSLLDIVYQMFGVIVKPGSFSSTMKFLKARGCVSVLLDGKGLTPTEYDKIKDYIELQSKKKVAYTSIMDRTPERPLIAKKENLNTLTVDPGVSTGDLVGADIVRSAFGSIEVGTSFTIQTLKDIVYQLFPNVNMTHNIFAATVKSLKGRGYVSVLSKGKGARHIKYKKKKDYSELKLRRKRTGKITERSLRAGL